MNNIQRAKVVMITIAIIIQVVLWSLVLFVVIPREKGPIWWTLTVASMCSIMMWMPFIRTIRGLAPNEQTDKQWYTWVAAPYCAFLGALVLFPISKAASAITFVAIFLSIQVYFYLKPHEK